ncbi:hypothetical protein SESBI_23823 [Sesbania bispinosa]|nr:hypothetical protein SESBI_23823 [Sesbania bispinosa]
MESSTDDNEREKKRMEKKLERGATTMNNVIRAKGKGEKIQVVWNEKGQPILPGGPTLVSYVGAITRQMVPITTDDWRDPKLKTTKENIWDDIKVKEKM